nr:immunoglobulin light chain junction region [Macaca mulatta]
CQQGNSNPWTF